jgi:prepilin-type N-terminal cleavage/methylation domain-containing protein/prepilin-type processing-associated H-X9-DG protein
MSAKRPRSSVGFTLVELLVVIAIIGVLVALLLPAVQAAREAARRAQCVNNLKQLAIGLHNHLDAHKRLPTGATNDPASYFGLTYGKTRQTWMVTLLPFIEEQSIYERYDQNYDGVSNCNWYGNPPPNPNSVGPNAPASKVIATMVCPTDTGPLVRENSRGDLAMGNYLAFFGDIAHDNGIEPSIYLHASPPNKRHAFGINFGAKGKDFVDGTSKTLLLGEYLRGLAGFGNDPRGTYYSDEAGMSQLYTQFTPNSSSPDVLWPGYCINRPEMNLPCSEDTNETAAARSRHTGGVNVALGDGSVRFVQEEIDLRAWQALGTLSGNESNIEF